MFEKEGNIGVFKDFLITQLRKHSKGYGTGSRDHHNNVFTDQVSEVLFNFIKMFGSTNFRIETIPNLDE
jgi:hypothetical protein